MPATPSPNDLTRHQLDELDLLLQRMLKLPLATPSADQLPTPAPIPKPEIPPGWRADTSAPSRTPHAHDSAPQARPAFASVSLTNVDEPRKLVEQPVWGPDPLARYAVPPEPVQPPEPAPRESLKLFGPPGPDSTVPPSTHPNPLPTGTLRGVDAPATPAGFKSRLAELAPPMPVEVEPPPTLVHAPRPQSPESTDSIPVLLMPLFAVNWILETVLSLFGPIGTASRSNLGKNLLAFVGLLLILAAGAWTAQGLGWIKLPIPFPR